MRMEAPRSVSDLRKFLVLVIQLGKLFPDIAEVTQRLCELLSSKHAWFWEPDQEAFASIK